MQPILNVHRCGRGGRTAFTLIELLVVIAVIGILVGLLMPAVQAARESARTAGCRNNLRQIGLATQLFHDTYRAFPPANLKSRPNDPPGMNCGGREPSWLVRILPYLEQTPFYSQWDLSQNYGLHTVETRQTALAVYNCPSRRPASQSIAPDQTVQFVAPCGCKGNLQFFPGGATVDYAGNMGDPSPGISGADTDFFFGGNGTGVIVASRPRCQGTIPVDWLDRIDASSIEDGLSNTALAGELHIPIGKLNQSPFNGPGYDGNHFAAFARIGGPGFPLAGDRDALELDSFRFGSWHPGGCNFTFADGSTRFLARTTSSSVLGSLCHRRDHATVSDSP